MNRCFVVIIAMLSLIFLGGLAIADSTIIAPEGFLPEAPEYMDGSFVVIYKDFNAWWGENKDESILQNELGLVKGVDYAVHPTNDLKSGISPDTGVVIITSNSEGWYSTMENVNDPASQANLEEFVEDGGILVMHLADNLWSRSFKAPGIPERTVDGPYDNDMNLVAPGDHPIVLGPDEIAGTADDLNQSNIQVVSGCCAHHGILPAPLPPGATIFIEDNNGDPVWAEYGLGAGLVIVSDLTLEWDSFPRRVLLNELYYAINAIPIQATVEIKPDTLDLKSKGVFTAFVDLPEDYNEADIVVDTVKCEGASALKGMMADNNKFVVKFDRKDLDNVPTGEAVELAVKGKLTDGTRFIGSDVIRVTSPGKPAPGLAHRLAITWASIKSR